MDPIDPLYLSDSLVQQSLMMMCPFGRTVLQKLSPPIKHFGVSLSRVAFLKSKQLLFLLILLSVESRFLASLLQLLTLSGRSQRVHLLDADGLSNSNCSTPKAGHVDNKIINDVIKCFPISAVLSDTFGYCASPINARDANLLLEIINHTTLHRAPHPCPRPSG